MQNRQDLGKKSHYFTIISYKNMYIRANVSILVFYTIVQVWLL